MQVDRVRVLRRVVDLPDPGVAEAYRLGDRIAGQAWAEILVALPPGEAGHRRDAAVHVLALEQAALPEIGGVVGVALVQPHVGGEGAILDGKAGLIRAIGQGTAFDQRCLVLVLPEVEAGQPNMGVEPRQAERVVVIPERRGLLGVVVAEGGAGVVLADDTGDLSPPRRRHPVRLARGGAAMQKRHDRHEACAVGRVQGCRARYEATPDATRRGLGRCRPVLRPSGFSSPRGRSGSGA